MLVMSHYYLLVLLSFPTRRSSDLGSLGTRRTLLQIPGEDGLPDGLTVDADGCIWLALWGGGEVRRITPEGAVVRSEEHTSELQSLRHLVCRLLLEKKKTALSTLCN